jgi:hypothetical protein
MLTYRKRLYKQFHYEYLYDVYVYIYILYLCKSISSDTFSLALRVVSLHYLDRSCEL